jgi:hypothetical protein
MPKDMGLDHDDAIKALKKMLHKLLISKRGITGPRCARSRIRTDKKYLVFINSGACFGIFRKVWGPPGTPMVRFV